MRCGVYCNIILCFICLCIHCVFVMEVLSLVCQQRRAVKAQQNKRAGQQDNLQRQQKQRTRGKRHSTMDERKLTARRRKHKNSRLGCPQCKQRRIKCDEELPSCHKCTSREARCGYLDYSPEEIDVIKRAHKDAEQLTRQLQAHYDGSPSFNTSHMTYTIPLTEDCYPLVKQYPHQLEPAVDASSDGSFTQTPSTGQEQLLSGTSPLNTSSLVFHQNDLLTHSLSHFLNKSASQSSTPSQTGQCYRTTISKQGTTTTLSLMPHTTIRPKFDMLRYPEYFDETLSGVFTRVYIMKENIERYEVATYNPGVFDVMMLFGHGRLVHHVPEVEPYFLARRGEAMRLLIASLDDITDANARTLLMVASSLTRTSVYMMSQTIKDHQTLSSGPFAIILKGLENPELFPSALAAMQRYADGMLVVYRTIYCPSYDPEVLVEFLEVLNDFGATYLHNEDLYSSDDPLVKSFDNMVEYIEYILDMAKTYKSDKYALNYPTNKLFEMFKRWYAVYPSMALTINSKMTPIEKVFYAFWHSLSFLMECCFYNCRYLFTYLFNGYYESFTMPKDVVLSGLNHDLTWYANYLCRIMAFMSRRRKYIVKYSLSDEFSIAANHPRESRSKKKPLEMHEEFITKFKTTLIRPQNYPREELNHPPSSESPTESTRTTIMIDQFQNISHIPSDTTVDMYNVNNRTSLLNNDYDPRFTDPVFEVQWNIQSCDAASLKELQEDKILILKREQE